MDKAIFEMKILRKVLLAPTIGSNDVVDWESMDTDDLRGLDVLMFQLKRDRLAGYRKVRLVCLWTTHIQMELSSGHQPISRAITDEQISTLLELMTCYLLQCKSFKDNFSISDGLLTLLVNLNVFLLASSKKQESEVWIRDHLSELKSVRCTYGTSILHHCMKDFRMLNLPIEPFVRLLVKEGKMDVNVVSTKQRETPLHWLSRRLCYIDQGQVKVFKPTEDTMKIAETLINNGAHMDAVDDSGKEASWFFSQRFPRWSFNVSLKCLAARALLKHGVRYEMCAPKAVIPFIESHKPKES